MLLFDLGIQLDITLEDGFKGFGGLIGFAHELVLGPLEDQG